MSPGSRTFPPPQGDPTPMQQSLPVSFSFQSPATAGLLTVLINLLNLDTSYKWNHTCGFFWWILWLLSLSMFAGFIRVAESTTLCYSFLWLNNIPRCGYAIFYWSLHQLTLRLFPPFNYWNSATVSICVQIFVWTPIFHSFEYIPRSGISGLNGKSVFNFVRNYPTVFHHSYTFYAPVDRTPISPRAHQHLCFCVVLFLAVLVCL